MRGIGWVGIGTMDDCRRSFERKITMSRSKRILRNQKAQDTFKKAVDEIEKREYLERLEKNNV
jgi:hypothetical protein